MYYLRFLQLPTNRKNKIELSKEPTLKTAINKNIQHVSLPIIQYGQDTVIGIDRTPAFVFRKMFQIRLKHSSTRCGRKVMRLATLCTNRQGCCLPLHMAVTLTHAVVSTSLNLLELLRDCCERLK